MTRRTRLGPSTGAVRRGITLVELMLAMSIIGMTVSFAAVKIGNTMPERALNSETRNFTRMLQVARSQAIAHRRFVAVEIDMAVYPDPDRIRLIDDATWDTGTQTWVGDELEAMDGYVVDAPHDFQTIGIGNTTYFVGIHCLVFSPTGALGLDDGSELGAIDVQIVRMQD